MVRLQFWALVKCLDRFLAPTVISNPRLLGKLRPTKLNLAKIPAAATVRRRKVPPKMSK